MTAHVATNPVANHVATVARKKAAVGAAAVRRVVVGVVVVEAEAVAVSAHPKGNRNVLMPKASQ